MPEGFLICIGVVVLIIICFKVVSHADEVTAWRSTKESTHPNMTFEQFESYFNVDPSKWALYEYNVAYLLEDKHGGWYASKKNIDFETFEDYKKYCKWSAQKEIEKNEKILLKNEMEVLQDIEKNIKKRMEREVKKDGNS